MDGYGPVADTGCAWTGEVVGGRPEAERSRRDTGGQGHHRPGDEAAGARAQLVFEDILDAAVSFGGTVTGEHGAGLPKSGGTGRGPCPAVQRAVKAAPDPHGILDPGKVVVPGAPPVRRGLRRAAYRSGSLSCTARRAAASACSSPTSRAVSVSLMTCSSPCARACAKTSSRVTVPGGT